MNHSCILQLFCLKMFKTSLKSSAGSAGPFMKILMSRPRLPSVMPQCSLVLISFRALNDRSTEAILTGIMFQEIILCRLQ